SYRFCFFFPKFMEILKLSQCFLHGRFVFQFPGPCNNMLAFFKLMSIFLRQILLVHIQHLIELVKMMEVIIVNQFKFRIWYLAGITPGYYYLAYFAETISTYLRLSIEVFPTFHCGLARFQLLCLLLVLLLLKFILLFSVNITH